MANDSIIDDLKKGPNMERHLQTLIVILITGLLGWVGLTVQQTQVAIAKLTVEVEYLKIEVAKPNEKFIQIEKRLDSIEQKLSTHMSGNRG